MAARFAVVVDIVPGLPCFLPAGDTGLPAIFPDWESAFAAAARAQFSDPEERASKRMPQIPDNAVPHVVRLQDG